jgi:hypothetical protein
LSGGAGAAHGSPGVHSAARRTGRLRSLRRSSGVHTTARRSPTGIGLSHRIGTAHGTAGIHPRIQAGESGRCAWFRSVGRRSRAAAGWSRESTTSPPATSAAAPSSQQRTFSTDPKYRCNES